MRSGERHARSIARFSLVRSMPCPLALARSLAASDIVTHREPLKPELQDPMRCRVSRSCVRTTRAHGARQTAHIFSSRQNTECHRVVARCGAKFMRSRNFTLFLRFALTFSIRNIERVLVLVESGARVGRDWGDTFSLGTTLSSASWSKGACACMPIRTRAPPARLPGHPWRRQCH